MDRLWIGMLFKRGSCELQVEGEAIEASDDVWRLLGGLRSFMLRMAQQHLLAGSQMRNTITEAPRISDNKIRVQ